jgi:hypothetical protein
MHFPPQVEIAKKQLLFKYFGTARTYENNLSKPVSKVLVWRYPTYVAFRLQTGVTIQYTIHYQCDSSSVRDVLSPLLYNNRKPK